MQTKFRVRLETRTASNGIPFLPMLVWYDSTHIARTDYYRNFVFGGFGLVAKGGFIEVCMAVALSLFAGPRLPRARPAGCEW